MRHIGLADIDRRTYLEAVVSTLPESVSVIDADMRVIDINKAGLDMIGVAHFDDVPGDAPLSLLSEQCRDRFRSAVRDALAGREDAANNPVRVDLTNLRGEQHLLDCRIAPLRSNDQGVEAVVVTARNVSEWQQAVDLAEQTSSVLQSILATVPDAMIVADEQGRISSFSSAAEKLLGYQESEVLGKNVSMLMGEPHRARHDQYIQRYLDTGEKQIIGLGREVEALHRDGHEIPVHLSIGEARAGGHRLFTGFIVDLSQQKKTQQEMRALQSDLLHSSRLNAVGTLASALAHEINQPLAAISNYLSAARDMMGGEFSDIREDLEEAVIESVAESQRAGEIIRRLREFISKGEVNRSLVSIAKLVEDATTLGLVGAYDQGIEASVHIDLDSNHVFVDRVQIQQVMVNLMRNAIDAMRDSERKQLHINVVSFDEDTVEIAVSDSGCGIDPDIAANLFNPFVTSKGDGMGLGLSICQKIVEAHDGSIHVEANPDGGTTFRVILPKATEEQTDVE